MKGIWLKGFALAAGFAAANIAFAADGSIKGTVTGEDGKPMGGVMISAFDPQLEMSVSVFSKPDGSFAVGGLPDKAHNLRARLLGMQDSMIENVAVNGDSVSISMKAATGEELQLQRPASDLLPFLKFDNEEDKLNFKMMCMYCHQVGTQGFRTPEEPVDWDTMVRRMQGFGGLFDHTQETLVQRLLDAYSVDAQKEWPAWTPPPAPSGKALNAVITEWDEGMKDNNMIHDLELGKNGLVYTVDMINDAVMELDPATGERKTYGIPGGKDPEEVGNPRKGPHSLEVDADGNMWITLALSGQMALFDTKTKEYSVVVSSAQAPRPRGAYPHTLRVAEDGVVWYTDAGSNSVFSLDPKNGNKVREFKLLTAGQVAGGGRGESGGITPYGISMAPDGKVWYTKLNGNRVGRVDPSAVPAFDELTAQAKAAKDAGDTAKATELEAKAAEQWKQVIKEWIPPHTGPRRLEVSPIDGLVWVPGYADGVLSVFNEKTEEWKSWDMPKGGEEIPYALSVHPKTGRVWVCGTGSDTISVFDPKTEEWTEYRMPSRVTYTREIEFAEDGSIWACNSNYPSRHIERGKGSVIKIEVPEDMMAKTSE